MSPTPIVVPFCLEITWQGTYGGRDWANVMAFFWNESDPDARADALDDIGTFAATVWGDTIATAVSQNVALTNIHVADVDSLSGSNTDIAASDVGSRSSTAMPGQVAVLVTKNTSHTRAQRNGRWFQVGACEVDTDNTNPSNLDSTGLSTFQTAFNDFFAAMDTVVASEPFYPVVFSKGSSPGSPIPIRVASMTVNSRLATQRRRIRG